MGTTITAMVVDAESDSYILGQVGDSRAYRFVDGELVQLTTDDTWVQEHVDAKELTPEQAKRHPFGHILTQCLGLVEPPTPGVLEGPVAPGELYLLCTDGLVGMIDDEEIAALLAEAFTKSSGQTAADEAAEALIAAANEAGGYDNITVAIVLIGAAS
jgi:protein phosphatase